MTTAASVAESADPAAAPFMQLLQSLQERVIGQQQLVEQLLIALLADGHVLIEGPPGVAKTRAAVLLAHGLSGDFQRIQFTPDLLPSDLLGTNVFDPGANRFEFHLGPLFHQFVLADEINRAPAKVQAALLEAMEERQITVAGQTRMLQEPFFVMATQNPIEEEGTYELPVAQLDRFIMRICVDYPDQSSEDEILRLVQHERQHSRGYAYATENLHTVSMEQLAAARARTLDVHLSAPIRSYIIRLVAATRQHHVDGALQYIEQPVSPRGTLAFAQLAQARAFLHGRDHVLPEDVQALADAALAHRLGLSFSAEANGIEAHEIVQTLLASVSVV